MVASGVLFLLGGKCKLSDFEKGVGRRASLTIHHVGCGEDGRVEEGQAVVVS